MPIIFVAPGPDEKCTMKPAKTLKSNNVTVNMVDMRMRSGRRRVDA